MKPRYYWIFCFKLLIFFYIVNLQATTLVFNMRVRRTFANLDVAVGKEGEPLWLATVLPIASHRDRHITNPDFGVNLFEKSTIGGSLFNIRLRATDNWWLEATTGVEHEHARFKGSSNFSASRTGFDDIVVAGGYNAFFSKKTQGVVYGIAGFPTRWKVTPFEADNTLVGTRFFSAGIGSELSYSFFQSLKKSLFVVFQNRFLHFFSRNWRPIFDRIQPGNVTDLLFATRYRQLANIFEGGYNLTSFTNLAVTTQTQKIEAKGFVRHNLYATYAHLFRQLPLIKLPGAIGTGLSAGFAKRFSIRVVTCWAYLTMVF